MAKFNPELIPLEPDLSFEHSLWEEGYQNIAGIDEAGRGPIAGPVTAAAVILPRDPQQCERLRGVRDSKQMTPIQREFWAVRLKTSIRAYGIGFASAKEIDTIGIAPATRLAILRAIRFLPILPDFLLLDYLRLPEISLPQTSLIKGDSRSLSIAAASVLAKTARDAYLQKLDVHYPGYGFSQHKGYATRYHLEALKQLGPSPIHRFSFEPVRSYI